MAQTHLIYKHRLRLLIKLITWANSIKCLLCSKQHTKYLAWDILLNSYNPTDVSIINYLHFTG